MRIKVRRKIITIVTLVFMVCSNMQGIYAANSDSESKFDLSSYNESSIYYDGNIITVNDDEPNVQAVAVGDGKIVGTGSEEEILKLKTSNTKLIDLNGRTMLPGFIDAHSHISMVGQFDDYSPAQGIISMESFIEKGKENFDKWYKKSIDNGTYEDGDWYVGNGFDNTVFSDAVFPSADDADEISSEIPVCIIHTSSHMAVLNHKALESLGYTKGSSMVNYLGDKIEQDSEGNPTGMVKEAAFFLLYYSPNILFDNTKTNAGTDEENLKDAMNLYAGYGITTAHDGFSRTIYETIENMKKKGIEPIIDINAYSGKESMIEPSYENVRDNRLKRAGVKITLDGSPQGKTAWFNEPYYIPPVGKDSSYRGEASMSDEDVYNTITACLQNNYQVIAHTNGTAAIDQFINMFEKAKNDTGITTDIRPVLIHAQTITEEQLDRCNDLKINVSFFHDHVYYWGDYHLASVLGPERAYRISPLASALRRDINVTIHQDSPVVPPNIIFGIHNAVNRVTRDGVKLGQEFAVDPMTAIKLVTINSAYQSFEENIKGSIECGKLADFVILDKNPLEVDKTAIKDIKVLRTIKEGKTIYSSNEDITSEEEGSPKVTVDTAVSGKTFKQQYTITAKDNCIDLAKLYIVYNSDNISENENISCDYAGVKITREPWYTNITENICGKSNDNNIEIGINKHIIVNTNDTVTIKLRSLKNDYSNYDDLLKESLEVYYDGVLVS